MQIGSEAIVALVGGVILGAAGVVSVLAHRMRMPRKGINGATTAINPDRVQAGMIDAETWKKWFHKMLADEMEAAFQRHLPQVIDALRKDKP